MNENDDPISAYAMWRYSNDFLEAAKLVCPPPISRRSLSIEEAADSLLGHAVLPAPGTPGDGSKADMNTVGYYLVSHSIELALKAFLRAQQIPSGILSRKPYGHNLNRLLDEASRLQLDGEVKLNETQKEMIRFHSQSYAGKRYEYFLGPGVESRVPYRDLYGITERLVSGLHPICVRDQEQLIRRRRET